MMLTIRQLATKLNVSTMTIRRYHTAGLIPPPKRPGGRLLRWDERDIDEWLASNCPRVEQPSPQLITS